MQNIESLAETPRIDSFQEWRQEVTNKNLDALKEFFASQETGDRNLKLSDRSENWPATRLVAQGARNKIAEGYRLSLEVLNGESWEPIVEPDMSATGSTHKTYDGSYRRSRPVYLSYAEVFQVAQNDMSRNWQNYVSLLLD